MFVFNRRSSTPAEFGDILADVAYDAPPRPRRQRLRPQSTSSTFDRLFMGAMCCASLSFLAFALMTSIEDPDYFSNRLISSLRRADDLDPINTGTVGPAELRTRTSLPVAEIARAQPLKPNDYQIVMVFEDEAVLATNDELMRVKVGSVLPGLGMVKEIVPSPAGGGMVSTEHATLKAVAP